jgi:hypothetical protein
VNSVAKHQELDAVLEVQKLGNASPQIEVALIDLKLITLDEYCLHV